MSLISPPEFRADLHCHTSCSDGSMTPTEIVLHAKERGLLGLSITDHDTVAAYTEALPIAKEEGILLGSGVEFSSVEGKISVHVLGYDIDLFHRDLIALCKKHKERRQNRNERILEKLKKQGMPLKQADLEKADKVQEVIGRPHIALAMVKKGYVSTFQEAFNRFIGEDKPCFDPGIPIATDETLEVIHASGGKAFLAHPHLMKDTHLVTRLLKKPFDGIECYYSNRMLDEEKRWIKKAQNGGLLISGGSDFHGAIKPSILLGCSWVNKEVFDQIFTRKW